MKHHPHASSPGDETLMEMRRASMGRLIEHASGTKDSTVTHWAAKYEIERRKNRMIEIRAWVAFGVSLGALIVSIIALITR